MTQDQKVKALARQAVDLRRSMELEPSVQRLLKTERFRTYRDKVEDARGAVAAPTSNTPRDHTDAASQSRRTAMLFDMIAASVDEGRSARDRKTQQSRWTLALLTLACLGTAAGAGVLLSLKPAIALYAAAASVGAGTALVTLAVHGLIRRRKRSLEPTLKERTVNLLQAAIAHREHVKMSDVEKAMFDLRIVELESQLADNER